MDGRTDGRTNGPDVFDDDNDGDVRFCSGVGVDGFSIFAHMCALVQAFPYATYT